jgi:orotate phosphoribosyltransferase
VTSLGERLHAAAYLHGSFVPRSGATTDHYFDKYRFDADPVLLREIAEAMMSLLPADTDALAGLELGGVPIATVLGQITGLPVRFIRKKAKEHGTAQLAEGGRIEGLRLTVIAVCAIDRETGGTEALAAEKIMLVAAFRALEMHT